MRKDQVVRLGFFICANSLELVQKWISTNKKASTKWMDLFSDFVWYRTRRRQFPPRVQIRRNHQPKADGFFIAVLRLSLFKFQETENK
jgi:hypothetical protein